MVRETTGVLTFLFTDIEGSVRLWERDPTRMAAMLLRHREIVLSSVDAHNGILVRDRGEGDSTFSVYAKPGEAAGAAIAIQRALHREAWDEDMPLRVRAALHSGTAYNDSTEGVRDYNSPTVNRCARLRALAYGSQTLITETVYQLLCDEWQQVPARDLGIHNLKDMRRPEHVYQLVHPPVPADFPPLVSPDRLAGNLPHPEWPLIGRRSELDAIRRLSAQSRLVTITGMGGVGKGRLALEAAWKMAEQFRDGVWHVGLISEQADTPVEEALLAALSISVTPGRPLDEDLIDSLKTKTCLILLMDCDNLRAECAALCGAILRHCPGVRLLVTAQSPLGNPKERIFPVGALATPSGGERTLADYEKFDSIKLFTDRAQSAAPDFRLTLANAPMVAEICRRLDGLPLGIELAASSLPYVGMAVLEKRLADPFSDGASAVLNASDAVDPVDRRTLLGVLESSYTLLSEPEKALLRQVSVFAAGWTLDSAEAVCLAPASGGANLLALLAQLVRRSLVVHSEKDGVVRYRLSRLVALFARRRLVDAGEEVDAARRYRDYFAGLAQRASAELDGELAGDWLDFLEEERGNLSAALAGFADDPEGTEPGIAMAVALYRFWTIRGHAGEGQAVLLRLLNRTGVRRTAAGARGLTALGSLSWERGRLAEARSLFQEALAVRTDLGDLLGVADVDNNLGNIAWEEGRFDEAQALFESSMATLESLNDEAGLAAVCGNLAALCCDIGDLDRAETLFERALRIDRARQDSWGIATSLDGIAVAARKRGEIHRAVMLRVEALRLRRQIQDRAGIVESLEGLVALLADRGEASDAAVLIGAADRQRELLESPLPPRRRLERRALVEALRDATAENYDECRRRGYEMTWQEVVDFAIVMDR